LKELAGGSYDEKDTVSAVKKARAGEQQQLNIERIKAEIAEQNEKMAEENKENLTKNISSEENEKVEDSESENVELDEDDIEEESVDEDIPEEEVVEEESEGRILNNPSVLRIAPLTEGKTMKISRIFPLCEKRRTM
jgi:phage terminase small subunit